MVHKVPNELGVIDLQDDEGRVTLGCYNFDIGNDVVMEVTGGGRVITIPPLCKILIPDQTRVQFRGASQQRNYWVTELAGKGEDMI